MRILQVISTLDPAWGGPVEGVRNLTAQFESRGHAVEVVCVDGTDAPWLKTWTSRIYAVGPGSLRYGFSKRLDHWLAENIRNYDVLVVHGVWMYFSHAVWKASRKAQVPYVLFTHGALDPWFKHAYPLKHIKKMFYWKLREHKVLRDARAVLFTTEEEKLLTHNAFRPYRCTPEVVGFGVADPSSADFPRTDDFAMSGHAPMAASRELPAPLASLGNRPYLLFLARIHEKKGIDLLLRAFAGSRRARERYSLVIAGPGDKKITDSLAALTGELGLDGSVLWTGPLWNEDKWKAIRAADAYILPSHQENFGVSVVEALACNVPVLISNKINIWPEIHKTGAGLVEPDDVGGTHSLLERWIDLSGERKEAMRRNARSCFLTHFEVTSQSARFLNLLDRVCAEPRMAGASAPVALPSFSGEP